METFDLPSEVLNQTEQLSPAFEIDEAVYSFEDLDHDSSLEDLDYVHV